MRDFDKYVILQMIILRFGTAVGYRGSQCVGFQSLSRGISSVLECPADRARGFVLAIETALVLVHRHTGGARQRPVHYANDFGEGNVPCRTSQTISPCPSARAGENAVTLQFDEYLFEEFPRDVAFTRDVADHHRLRAF